jgi:4a-hydroxytetrahydrobiopterin dehydratase
MLPIKDWSKTLRRSLTPTQIVASLAKLEDWRLTGDGAGIAIEKEFTFANYFHTMAFVNGVALIAHTQDHHPALEVLFNRCLVKFNTHDVQGLSANDFECAALVDALLKRADI